MRTYTTEKTTIDLLASYLRKYGWSAFQVIEDTSDGGKILTGWHAQFVDQSRVMFLAVDHRQDMLLLVVPALVSAPQEKMPIGQLADVLMALGFANFALAIGRFCYDPSDGEIRFETGVPIDSAALSFEQFSPLLNAAQAAVGYWAPRLKDVAESKRTGDAVVESFLGHARDFPGGH